MNILAELKALVPPLSGEEFSQLEQNCIAAGIRDALIIAEFPNPSGEAVSALADGHNRYEIAQRHGLEYRTELMKFGSLSEVKVWMIDNQRGRRNLTDGWKWQLAQVKAELLRDKGREVMAEKGKIGAEITNRGLSIIDKPRDEQPHNSQKEIAKDLGWSTGKVAMADKVWKEAPEEIKTQVLEGELTFGGAYKLGKKAHVSNNSGNNEWYTPKAYAQSAKLVMGSIDLDPASSAAANKVIEASVFYDEESNGLNKQWFGNIWMNPPYSQPLIAAFIEKLISSEFSQAIVLVNNATETAWGQMLLGKADAVCFHKGRIKFVDASGRPGESPLQGQMICYIGEKVGAFVSEFSKYGTCLIRG